MTALWPALLPPSRHGDDDLCLRGASGVRLSFLDGSERLCATSGLWNVNLGYGNEAIAKAVGEATRDASYLGVFRWENDRAREAADLLCEAAGSDHFGKVLFSTSGGAANDLVMKLVRHHHALRGDTRRRLVVGLRDSYHGLMFGSAALTADDLGQQLYGVDRRLVRHVPPNDVASLVRLLEREGAQVAAVVVEPVLGTGALPLTSEYVDALVRLRDEHGFLLVADEVATGFGRTGDYFASQTWPGRPDVMVTSKGLTNGTCAAAAVLVSHEVADVFAGADAVIGHAETQAGTATTAAAIIATIEQMAGLDAVERGRGVARLLDARLDRLAADEPAVQAHTGRGCFRAVTVADAEGRAISGTDVADLVTAIRRAGAVVHPGPHGFQLIPALVYTEAEVDELFGCVRAGLAAFTGGER